MSAGTEFKADWRTMDAAKIIVDLLTSEEQALMDIDLAGKKIPLFDQLVARGVDQIPIDDNRLVFRAKAAQILVTNKRGIQLLANLRNEDFMMKLLDPSNYREKHEKGTVGKTTDKRKIDTINDNVSLIKTIGRNISGQSGTNRDADYGAMGDKADRARLDKVQIRRNDRQLLSTETGQEDDTRGTDEQETSNALDVKKFIEKEERLDHVQARRKGGERPIVTLQDNYQEIEEKKIDIFDLSLNHQTNSTVSDNAVDQNTFIEANKRQGFLTLRERFILADTINNLHNVEFPDTREKFFKLFDPLFRRVEKLCR